MALIVYKKTTHLNHTKYEFYPPCSIKMSGNTKSMYVFKEHNFIIIFIDKPIDIYLSIDNDILLDNSIYEPQIINFNIYKDQKLYIETHSITNYSEDNAISVNIINKKIITPY